MAIANVSGGLISICAITARHDAPVMLHARPFLATTRMS